MTTAEENQGVLAYAWAMSPSVADTTLARGLTLEAAAAILDRRARILLDMTGPEFTAAYRTGTLPADAPDAIVQRLARLIPASNP